MTRLTLLLLLLGLALIVSPVSAAGIPPGTTSVSFTGFCDGATITTGSGSLIGGSHDNWDCNGGETFIAGVAGKDALLAPNPFPTVRANMADNVGVLALSNAALQLYLDFNNMSFAFFTESDGSSPEKLVNKGKFTIGMATKVGGVAAWQGAGVPDDVSVDVVDNAFPKGPYTITFSIYCDFFDVVTKGHKAGGLHDLTTNCGLVSVPFAANDSNVASDITGTAGASLLETDNEFNANGAGDELANFYFNFTNDTWSAYGAVDTTGPFLINSGTFTLTPGVVHNNAKFSTTGMAARQ